MINLLYKNHFDNGRIYIILGSRRGSIFSIIGTNSAPLSLLYILHILEYDDMIISKSNHFLRRVLGYIGMVVTLLDQLSGFGEQHFMLSELFEIGPNFLEEQFW